MNEAENPAQFPCVRNCCLSEENTCLGCFRTLEEIMHWSNASTAERKAILGSARQRKAAHKARVGDDFSTG